MELGFFFLFVFIKRQLGFYRHHRLVMALALRLLTNHCFSSTRTLPRNTLSFRRSITMSSIRLQTEEAVEKLKSSNPYYEKYAAKLSAMQQAAPEKFLEKVNQVVAPVQSPKVVEKPRDYSELLNPKEKLAKKPDEIPHKQLDAIMKLDLVSDKNAAEIEQIWLEYHKQKDVLIATIPVEQYDKQLACGKKHPMFIIPLPRSEGFEFILFQFAANTVHFTPLLCYQVHKENAPECLNIVYYTELRDKGIVLMRGEYDKNVITAQEAQCLANQLQLYYAQESASKRAILEKFTKKPAEFDHNEVIKELENLTL